jgi:hypothetical protein
MDSQLRSYRAPSDDTFGGRLGFIGSRVLAFALLFSIAPASALEISARQVGSDSFQFVLLNGATLSEREAQAYIADAAKSVCKGRLPVLGKYTFDSKEQLGTGPLLQTTNTFRFVQNVSCVPVSVAAPKDSTPAAPFVVDEQKTQDEVRSRSEHYFHLLSDNKIDDAYEEMSKTQKAWDEVTWKREKKDFQSKAGKPRSITIVKITLYKNPAEAPEPGLYVAADYSNVYDNAPIQCGYLMWFRTKSGNFEITREETGFVTSEQLKQIPAEQVPELKAKLRCVAP